MGAQRWCWLLAASAAVWQTVAEEESEATPRAFGISVTLLASVSFMMLWMYALNYNDRDIRKYAYATIVSTLSIFIAVLIFSSVNDMLQWYVIRKISDDGETGMTCAVRMLHMLFWYVWMQVYLAYVCGVFWSTRQGFKTEFLKFHGFELNVKCWAMLLAHLTGFASIYAWGSLQQLPFFRSSPGCWRTLLVLPAAALGGLILQRVTGKVRNHVSMMDGARDSSEIKWATEAAECEDDVVGLTLSFNAVQSIRCLAQLPNLEDANLAQLPNLEGFLEVKSIPGMTGRTIFFVGVICIVAAVLAIKRGFLEGEEGESDSDSEEREEGEEGGGQEGDGHLLSLDAGNSLNERIQKRFYKKVVVTLSMIFAWCCFYSGQLLVARVMKHEEPLTLHEQWHEHEMLSALVLALLLSILSFFGILILDWLADRNFFNKVAVTKVILSMGLVVGFSWEQCFDMAIDSIGSWSHPHVQLVKALLAAGCVGVLVPAYKRFFLPMQLIGGHRHGFVVHRLGERGTEELCHVALKVTTTLNKRLGKIDANKLPAGEARGGRRGSRTSHDSMIRRCCRPTEGPDREEVLRELEKVHEVVKKLEETVGNQIDAIKGKGYHPPEDRAARVPGPGSPGCRGPRPGEPFTEPCA